MRTVFVLFDSLMRRRLDPTRAVVLRAIERGELPAETDLELAVEAVTAAAVMRVYFLPTDPHEGWMDLDITDLEEILDLYQDLCQKEGVER